MIVTYAKIIAKIMLIIWEVMLYVLQIKQALKQEFLQYKGLVNRFTREGKSIYPVKSSVFSSQSAGKSIYLQGKSIYPVKNWIFPKIRFPNTVGFIAYHLQFI
jgi:ribosomal protein S3AE